MTQLVELWSTANARRTVDLPVLPNVGDEINIDYVSHVVIARAFHTDAEALKWITRVYVREQR